MPAYRNSVNDDIKKAKQLYYNSAFYENEKNNLLEKPGILSMSLLLASKEILALVKSN